MELPEADQPPERIWLNDEAIADHFESVRGRYGSTATEEVPDADMAENEFTKGLR